MGDIVILNMGRMEYHVEERGARFLHGTANGGASLASTRKREKVSAVKYDELGVRYYGSVQRALGGSIEKRVPQRHEINSMGASSRTPIKCCSRTHPPQRRRLDRSKLDIKVRKRLPHHPSHQRQLHFRLRAVKSAGEHRGARSNLQISSLRWGRRFNSVGYGWSRLSVADLRRRLSL